MAIQSETVIHHHEGADLHGFLVWDDELPGKHQTVPVLGYLDDIVGNRDRQSWIIGGSSCRPRHRERITNSTCMTRL